MATQPVNTLNPAQVNYSDAAQYWQIVKQALDDTRVATPAFLTEDMDAIEQTVTAQIAISERVRTSKGAQWTQITPVAHVPVVLPRGGGYALTLPLKKGDEGLLVFCDTCFDYWWKYGALNGGGSRPQLEVRRHHFWDCGFIPGMCSQVNLLPNYSATSAQLRSDDGTTVIDLSSAGITLKTDGAITLDAGSVAADDGSGAQFLMNDTFFQWYVTNIQPFLVSKGYTGPAVPMGSETTVLKGQ